MRRRVLLAIPLLLIAACVASPGEEVGLDQSALVTSGSVGGPLDGGVLDPGGPSLADGVFIIRALGKRCWDFGPPAAWAAGAPVFLSTCNGSAGQQIHVTELPGNHDVQLRTQSGLCLGVGIGHVEPGQGLDLQLCESPGYAAQLFAYDGDEIMMGRQAVGGVTRDYVIESAGGASNQTPLVVGTRDGSDAEYFRMASVDGTSVHPHNGFINVNTEAGLDWALSLPWGTVIEVDPAQPLVLTSTTTKVIHAGVTLRGYRKGLVKGPEIVFPNLPVDAQRVFEISEGHVRITGLTLTGPSGSTDETTLVTGVAIWDGNDVLVDHIEAQHWTESAIAILGETVGDNLVCAAPPPSIPRPTPVRVWDNFIHDNQRDGSGYGVVVHWGAFGQIRGNLFYDNRHAIAADGGATTGYQAIDNFVLRPSPTYSPYVVDQRHEQDFDKHGTDKDNDYNGGLSDDYADFGWNTFLGINRANIDERGTPCRSTSVHDSVFRGDSSEVTSRTTDDDKLLLWNNAFDAIDPTFDLGVADFDGDGVDDLFVGTGATWWYSSGGQTEWRYLNQAPEHARDLLFGDFDGDGRADVLALHGTILDVSWGGTSPWKKTNTVAFPLSNLAIGDFDGDHRADIFLATGNEWFYAPGGQGWIHFAFAAHTRSMLRFGDFNNDGKTDVFGVVGKLWEIVPGGGDTWQPLRAALTPSVDGLLVGDFDGDHFADVARSTGLFWEFSSRATGAFVPLRPTHSADATTPVIGRFDGDAKSDALFWRIMGIDEFALIIAPGGASPTRIFPRAFLN